MMLDLSLIPFTHKIEWQGGTSWSYLMVPSKGTIHFDSGYADEAQDHTLKSDPSRGR